jgi:YD repeat-containing protein
MGHSQDRAVYILPEGLYLFAANGNRWWPDSDVPHTLTSTPGADGKVVEWIMRTPENTVEIFDGNGKLVQIRYPDGRVENLSYSDLNTPVEVARFPGSLIQVLDNHGRGFQLAYDDMGRVRSVTYADGATVLYQYDVQGRLAIVTYPGGARRQYLYNEPAYQPAAGDRAFYLTGIADERSPGAFTRYATFTYNSQGGPRTTEHNGFNKYVVDGDASTNPLSPYYTDPLGAYHSFDIRVFNNLRRPITYYRPSITGSRPVVWRRFEYDANSNIVDMWDFDDTRTNYTYDLQRNLETRRIEAYGTSAARTVSTQWHPVLRLPIAIAAPGRKTTFSYDANGNLLSRTVQATSDTTGASGFGAVAAGTPRTWTFTYNSVGQVLTSQSPRAQDVTTYAYDAAYNLESVTNALGHVTRYSNHDALGRVGRVTQPNGISTDYSYHPRGWLASMSTDGDTTSFAYDGAGVLTHVTLPDGTTLNYSYDDGRRLVGVTDSVGNSVRYTLDAAGNRLKEEFKDPNGQLTRQITRVFDSLSNLKQETGGAQ